MRQIRLRKLRRRLGLYQPAGSPAQAHGPGQRPHSAARSSRPCPTIPTCPEGWTHRRARLRHLRRTEVGHHLVVPAHRAASGRGAAGQPATGAALLRPALGRVAHRRADRALPPLLPAAGGQARRREDARVHELCLGAADGQDWPRRRPGPSCCCATLSSATSRASATGSRRPARRGGRRRSWCGSSAIACAW